MKILFVSAEVAPFSTVGGLSQVSYFLPRALLKLGHDVRIFSAKYGVIDGSGGSLPVKKKWPMKMEAEGLAVPTGSLRNFTQRTDVSQTSDLSDPSLICNLKSSRASRFDPLVYFLENREYFEMRANVYQYADDHIRFGLLSKGCLEWLLRKDEGQRTKDEGNTGASAPGLQPSAFSLQPSAFSLPATGGRISSTSTTGIPPPWPK